MTTRDRKYGFLKIYEEDNKQFETEINPNPTINKKGKQINLRDLVNESFESADLQENIKNFANIKNITKEQIFMELDDEILKADMRDIIEINKKASEQYQYMSAMNKRNLNEQKFADEYKKYKEKQDKNEIKTKEEVKTNE